MPRKPKCWIYQVCEICQRERATTITHNKQDDKWYYCCSECLSDGYWIPFDRLDEMDWYGHMMKKGWVDTVSFLPRLYYAHKQVNGIRHPNLTKPDNH